ncbi:MAG: lipopolysaccharide assembly protein LapA domain-containing protein [Candidatus Berkiellales bacterium]
MRVIGMILALILLVVGAAFAVLNAKPVEINYFFGSADLPLALLLLIAFALGVVLCMLVMGFSLMKLKAKNKWLQSKMPCGN